MLHIQHLKKLTKIIADGALDDEECERLQNELNNNKNMIEILMVDIKYLSLELTKTIVKKRHKIKIESTEKSLWSYLHKLGVAARYNNVVSKDVKFQKKDIKIIAFGGSAGSIDRLNKLIPTLPYVDIAVFITIHIKPDRDSLMPQIWQALTKYKVVHAIDNTKVEPNHIYIAPPNHHMIVKNNTIYLTQTKEVCFARPSIDVTFESLAKEYKHNLLAILLSGYGKDGSNSLNILKKNNSTVIIEDPNGCEAQDMPLNAMITRQYDKVLSLLNIENYIQSLFSVNLDLRDAINSFCDSIYQVYGYDFRNYDKNSLSRRIEQTMHSYNIDSFKEFEVMVLDNVEIFDKLLKEFSINVTSFFRNPQTYKGIRDTLLPQLDTYPNIRIWCAGCSRGDEPYSIAIMLDEAGLLNKTQIYATDFNQTILEEAKNGLFDITEFDRFKSNYKQSGGVRDFEKWFDIDDTFVQIKQHIKDKILFSKHNLVVDKSINEFNLILCRNVMIYFDNVLKKKVFKLFDNSLMRNGYLVLGSSELHEEYFDYKKISKNIYKIYQKTI
jgi:chemotaxis protein methyltransferase CheR